MQDSEADSNTPSDALGFSTLVLVLQQGWRLRNSICCLANRLLKNLCIFELEQGSLFGKNLLAKHKRQTVNIIKQSYFNVPCKQIVGLQK